LGTGVKGEVTILLAGHGGAVSGVNPFVHWLLRLIIYGHNSPLFDFNWLICQLN
jgi:hypothetical protein